jgi:endonuclease YncB( thermonuclease family)
MRVLLLTAVLAACPAFAASRVVEGRAVGISDGDTITVLDDSKSQHKVRIAAIDAPEKGQAFGERSKQNLSALVFQKQVEARCHKKDRYGREVCAVFVSLRDVGLEQIRTGMLGLTRHTSTSSRRRSGLSTGMRRRPRRRRGALWKDAKPAGAAVRVARARKMIRDGEIVNACHMLARPLSSFPLFWRR